MANLGSMSGREPLRVPTPPRGVTIARYETYLDAQRAVDFLSDNHFPVQMVTIVGSGLRMVERVTGRLTYPRVALAGAASGAWFGLFVGLVLSMFNNNAGAMLAAPLFGAGFGMLFGVISYALTGGRRDFTSTSQIVAGEYEVWCLPEQAGAARELLRRLPGGASRVESAVAPPAAPQSSLSVATAPAPEPVPADPAAPLTGPTYGEMIEKQRRERLERERAEESDPDR